MLSNTSFVIKMTEADLQLRFDLTTAENIKYQAVLQIMDFEIEMRAKLGAENSNNYEFMFTDIILSHASNFLLQISGQSNSMNQALQDTLTRDLLYYLTEKYNLSLN